MAQWQACAAQSGEFAILCGMSFHTEENSIDALRAIQEEVEKLRAMELPEEAAEIIELIDSIARFGHDVRTEEEK